MLGRFLFHGVSEWAERGETDGWVWGTLEFGLGMELLNPDKESVEKKEGRLET